MNAQVGRLIPYVMVLQIVVGLGACVVFGLGAPGLLLLDAEQTRGALVEAIGVAVGTEVLALALIYRRLGRVSYVLRALALGSRAFEPDELAELSRVPAFTVVASSGVALGFALLTLLPFVRSSGIDLSAAVSLFLLAMLVVVAAGLPLYVLVRGAVSRALELAPADASSEALALLEQEDTPRRRTLLHMVAAVVMPLGLVALGAALVAYAHVRSAAEQARIDTAIALARGALEEAPGVLPDGGRREALRQAQELGFVIRARPQPSLFGVEREEDGTVSVAVPLREGHGSVVFQGTGGAAVVPGAAAATALFLVLALGLGWRLGRALSDDLLLASRQVRMLGNEDVLRGGARIARPARFQAVAWLGRAMEALAERFRVFAAAQERSIEAREAALRLRGLLFASVSHDLKDPLNAVLNFCVLTEAEPLDEPQRESLRIIERRGRELLALIETILDAARVEAQQMTLNRTPVDVRDVLERAVLKGDELGPMDAAPVELDVDEALPTVVWDDARMVRALAALVGHAKRLAPGGGVRIEASLDGPAILELLVHEPSGALSIDEVTRLLDATGAAMAPRRSGGLALGLSLARAILRLHGGSLDVHEAAEGGVVFRARLPVGGGQEMS